MARRLARGLVRAPEQRRVRLAGSVVKLLEEVVSDNGAANELLMADVHIDPAMKGFFSYASADGGRPRRPHATSTCSRRASRTR